MTPKALHIKRTHQALPSVSITSKSMIFRYSDESEVYDFRNSDEFKIVMNHEL